MTLREFAKLAIRKRKAAVPASKREPAVITSLPLGQKKEDTLDRYQDYEGAPPSHAPSDEQAHPYTGGEIR